MNKYTHIHSRYKVHKPSMIYLFIRVKVADFCRFLSVFGFSVLILVFYHINNMFKTNELTKMVKVMDSLVFQAFSSNV